ncbi:hypothetical protein NP511_22170 (plasmid) [Natrinema thermotolerans]|uniref:Uncharacterized protein n=1 Tax=Natrinema thermotolerans TaxID=121872 RepID=A0AAF0PHB0_9EURY|nr:hypothetical protein [Natrinema thermotolerans]WMT10304.1 hypothetical protein NP511_22170 [Natrinema thermotolerans]
MSEFAAMVLGGLVSILCLLSWSIVTDAVPGHVGVRGTLFGFIIALIAGLTVYITFTQQR